MVLLLPEPNFQGRQISIRRQYPK